MFTHGMTAEYGGGEVAVDCLSSVFFLGLQVYQNRTVPQLTGEPCTSTNVTRNTATPAAS